MNPGKLATLKDKLVTGTDFSEVMRWFFDEITTAPDFTTGDPCRDKMLIEALTHVVSQVAGIKTTTVVEAMLFRLPEHGFTHGAITFGNQMGSVIYFEDIERGLLALGDMTGPTHFARFSLIKAPNGRNFTIN